MLRITVRNDTMLYVRAILNTPSEDRLKKLARAKFNVYLRRGKFHKKPCEKCGSIDNIEAHHDDYTRPFDVRWLCRKHHKEHHVMANLPLMKCECGGVSLKGQRNCSSCHAKRMREWRKAHTPGENQRVRGIARSKLAVYVRRGKVSKTPCAVCGAEKVIAKILDYNNPLKSVTWLCREHHLAACRKGSPCHST